ncbi:hypothetical protein JNW90_07675 [Micromonospora sp. STR1s_5]|nr:hypothetical protein [Micromonospora sp. STR1s_5]
MGIAWRESPEELVGLLRRHGLAPDRVDKVDTALACASRPSTSTSTARAPTTWRG